MTEVQLLTTQTENAYEWTNKLIREVPFEKRDTLPETLQTSISWQVGHLIVSHYFHSVMVIVGHRMDILKKIPLKDYDAFFTNGSPEHSIGKVRPALLLEHLELLQRTSADVVRSLTPEQLESKLEPTPAEHPIATIKREAIDWNIKHTMYHCGQIGILKRVVDHRHDFGLRRPH